jgi:hypothetical protein
MATEVDQQELAQQLLAQARERGIDKGRARWATRWKPALNAFAITFDGRIN